MRKLKAAVIGVGHLGQFHAQKYAMLDECELVAIADINQERAQTIAASLNCNYTTNYQELAEQVDLVSIVTPTTTHFNIGKYFLERKVHTLIEKPLTPSVELASQLIKIAEQNNCILQVGYLERFNPIFIHAKKFINNPYFIDSQRIMPFNPRNKDINVIEDLMVHDIDLIHDLLGHNINSISSFGRAVVTNKIDISNATLRFNDKVRVNITASRISSQQARKMIIWQEDSILHLDFQKNIFIYKDLNNPAEPQYRFSAENSDALLEEIKSFIHAVLHSLKPQVCGHVGVRNLATAYDIICQST